jgi:hypothetical protein
MACLCINTNTYSRKCCNGALLEQGIGLIQGTPRILGAFDDGYDTGFDTEATQPQP